MRGVALRIGGILLILLVTGLVVDIVRPREFLLTFCAIGLLMASLFGIAAFRAPRLRNLFLVLATTGLIASLLDPITYLSARRSAVEAEGTWNERVHFLWDADLGIGLPPNAVATSRKSAGDKVVYDVTYTIDANGHRRVVGSTDPAADNVVFMGCSFTFGEGLEDIQTLPQQFSDLTGRKFNVTNFGVSSFGIHQPLRSLELGRLDPILTAGKRYVIYTGIPDHANRAAATTLRGPRYQLQADGSVKYAGQNQSFWLVYAVAIANRSLFLRLNLVYPLSSADVPDAVPLYVALVKRAGEVARDKYHAKFIFIFWDEPENRLAASEMAGFDKAKIAYVRVSTILPDYLNDQWKYRLSRYDLHPNAMADRLIAQYLAQHLDDTAPQP